MRKKEEAKNKAISVGKLKPHAFVSPPRLFTTAVETQTARTVTPNQSDRASTTDKDSTTLDSDEETVVEGQVVDEATDLVPEPPSLEPLLGNVDGKVLFDPATTEFNLFQGELLQAALTSDDASLETMSSDKRIAKLQKKVKSLETQLAYKESQLETQGRGYCLLQTENEAYKKTIEDHASGNKEIADSVRDLSKSNAQLMAVNKSLEAENKKLKASGGGADPALLKRVQTENKELKQSNEALKLQLAEATKSLRGAGKGFLKAEVNDMAVKKINTWVKEVGYREWKFSDGPDEQREFAEMAYNGIKDDRELGWAKEDADSYLGFEEFNRIYDESVRKALNSRRQYTQTKCKNAITGKFASDLAGFALN